MPSDTPSRNENIVPIVFLISSCCPVPTARAMMTCPAEEKPIATKVSRCRMSPPMETADMPAFPI